MGNTTALRRELKRMWVPLLESRGFSVDMSDAPTFVRFRRTAGDLGRLRPRRGRSKARAVLVGADWFSQDTPLLQRLFGREKLRAPDDVVRGLVSLLPELEAYWVSGAVGEHLTIMRIPRQG